MHAELLMLFVLTEIAEADRISEDGHVHGKLVVLVARCGRLRCVQADVPRAAGWVPNWRRRLRLAHSSWSSPSATRPRDSRRAHTTGRWAARAHRAASRSPFAGSIQRVDPPHAAHVRQPQALFTPGKSKSDVRICPRVPSFAGVVVKLPSDYAEVPPRGNFGLWGLPLASLLLFPEACARGLFIRKMARPPVASAGRPACGIPGYDRSPAASSGQFARGICAGWEGAGGRLRLSGQHKKLICRCFTGATGLEPATSGVTGRFRDSDVRR